MFYSEVIAINRSLAHYVEQSRLAETSESRSCTPGAELQGFRSPDQPLTPTRGTEVFTDTYNTFVSGIVQKL